MKTFAEYYKDLLEWESIDFQELISAWDIELVTEIKHDFAQSIPNSKLKDLPCPLRENSSNQSIGNQVADYFTKKLNEKLEVFSIENCEGKGYPDRILAKDGFKQIALEMKATSDWNPKDSNRRVLTSSSNKLRNNFTAPVFHLICTVIYQIKDETAIIEAVRLDFIDPNTEVSVRLEASVNHKILTNGNHQSIVF